MRTLLLLTIASGSLFAQDRPGDNAAAARIAEGVEKARAGQLLDAVEQFQRVLDTAGDDLVPVDRYHHAPARWVVHGHLAKLPAEGVRLYRQRIDGQAAKRLDEAKKGRSDAGLRRLLADMFVSRPSEEAILELARRNFERGDFDAAEHYWKMLYAGDETEIRYPDPKTPPPAVLARLVLVKLFQGDRSEAVAGLALLKEKHPNDAGLLAGKTGKYVDTLTDLMARPAETTLPRPPDDRDWPTFAGSAARTGTTRARLPYFWPDVPAWRIKLPWLMSNSPDAPPPNPLHPKALAFHPIVADGRAYVADGARLFSIDLLTGKFTAAAWAENGEDAVVPTRHDVRYTLTATNGIVYARLGPAALTGTAKSYLAAFAKKPDGEDREQLWRLNPPTGDGATCFEGAPVVRGDKLYAAYWRQAGADAVAGVACYRLDEPKSAPDLVWQRQVGKAGAEPNNETRYRHELLSIAGPNVVFATNGGTVIALDAATGRPAWEYRYPRNERPTLPRHRDLCPPLVDGGRIYAAPADTDRLLCLDAYTGRLIWERETIEVIHLLGVAKGRLIATVGGQIKGIRGFNVRTGADSGDAGWTIHDDGGEMTFGRGLVSDEAVIWPTRNGLHFLNPTDGTPLRSPIPGSFGNLTYGDGCLIVTTATEVWGYPTEAKKLGERRKAVEKAPEDPKKNADLAQSLIDAASFDELEKVIAKAGDGADRVRWFLAERLIRAGQQSPALEQYKLLAGGKSAYATAAAVRRAELCVDKNQARDLWRAVFLKPGSLRDHYGIPWPTRVYAQTRFGQMLKMRGTGVTEDLVGGPEEIAPAAFVRMGVRRRADPSLRVLSASQDGVISTGDRLVVDPDGLEQRIDWGPTTGAIGAHELWIGGPNRATSMMLFRGQMQTTNDVQARGPIVAEMTRATYPCANDTDHPAALSSLAFESDTVTFRYGHRAIGRFETFEGFGSVLLAPSSTTAGFHPHYRTKYGYVLAQLTNGRMLVRGRDDNEPREYPASLKPWPEPPTHIGGDRFLLVDDRGVHVFDATKGKAIASHIPAYTENATGELPRVRVHGDQVILISNQNHGVEIVRLKVSDLKWSWSTGRVFVGRELSNIRIVGDQVIVAADGGLSAYLWANGEKVWDALLPEAPGDRWTLADSSIGVIAHPAEAVHTTQEPAFADEVGQGGWLWGGLLRFAGKSYHHWATRELPVLVVDPADGRLVQRLTFPAAGPAAGVAVARNKVCVVTGAGSWTLAPR